MRRQSTVYSVWLPLRSISSVTDSSMCEVMRLRASLIVMPVTSSPSTDRMMSPRWSPAFSAGEPSVRPVISKPPVSESLAIETPRPMNWFEE